MLSHAKRGLEAENHYKPEYVRELGQDTRELVWKCITAISRTGGLYVGTQSRFQIDSIVRPSTKTMFGGSHHQPDVAKREGKECKIRRQEIENTRTNWFEIFMKFIGKIMKLLYVKVHYHEIDVCHMSIGLRIIITNL